MCGRSLGFVLLGLIAWTGCDVTTPATVPTPSVWELVEAPAEPYLGDKVSSALLNRREIYTEAGQLCVIQPHETLSDATECADVDLGVRSRTIRDADGRASKAQVAHLNPKSLTLRAEDGSVFEYRRLPWAAAMQPIKPQNLQIIRSSAGEQMKAQDVRYLPVPERHETRSLLGVWEAIARSAEAEADEEDESRGRNQKWVFRETEISILAPVETEDTPGRGMTYRREGDTLYFPDLDSAMSVSFSVWGDLILTYEGDVASLGSIVLRQLTSDPETIPMIPTKLLWEGLAEVTSPTAESGDENGLGDALD